jgi:flagellar basal-body rod protein FlgC
VKLDRTKTRHLPEQGVARVNGTNVYHARTREHVDPAQGVKLVYDPSHPDANPDGFVAMPDIDPLVEMVEMMTAARAYDANITAVQAVKDIAKKSLEI